MLVSSKEGDLGLVGHVLPGRQPGVRQAAAEGVRSGLRKRLELGTGHVPGASLERVVPLGLSFEVATLFSRRCNCPPDAP